jgi:hypothetical protein
MAALSARAEPASSPSAEVDLLYTGSTGGVGNASFSASTVSILARQIQASGGSARVEKEGPGALALGSELLLEPRGLRRKPLVGFLGQPRSEAKVLAERLPALEGEHDLTFQYPLDPELDLLSFVEAANRGTRADPTLHRIEVRLLEHRTASGGLVLQVERGAERLGPLADPLAWEGLWAARGAVRLGQKATTFYSVFKALGSGARRVRLLDELRGGLPPGTALLLSGGNEVSTVDPLRPERTSPVRDLDFSTLMRTGYAAVVPGDRELYFGLGELREQLARSSLPMVATNLFTRKKDGGLGPAPFPRFLVLRAGNTKIGVLGLVSPDLGERVSGPQVLSELAVTDAASAASEALAQMRQALGGEADLVVAVSALRGAASAEYLSQAQGVDLFIGDFGEGGLHAPEQVVTAASRQRNLGAERRPLMQVHASPLRVGWVRVDLTREGELVAAGRLADRQFGVLADLPRDEALQRQLASLAQDDLAQEDVALVPSLEELESAGRPADGGGSTESKDRAGRVFTSRLWSQLVVNLLRASSDAEIAVIRSPPAASGQVFAAHVERTLFNWVSAEDALVACELTGAQLRGLPARVGETAMFSGFDVEKMLVGGRPVNDTERYRAVLAAPLLVNPSVERLLRGVETHGRFHLSGGRLAEDARGRTVRLGEVVFAVLREHRGHSPSFEPAYLDLLRSWLSPQGRELEPRWSLGVEGLTLSLTGYANAPGNAWVYNQGIREARTSTASNAAALFKSTLFATYDSGAYTWDNRVVAGFAYSVVRLGALPGQQNVVSKPEDDLWTFTELRLKRLRVDFGPGEDLRFVSYLTAGYDTEFTNTTNPLTGATYPRRKDLLASVGLVRPPGKIFKLVRLGPIARADFVGKPHVDGGVLVASRVELGLGKALVRLGAKLRYFFPASHDTVDQLGLNLDGSTTLLYPLTRDLALTLGVDFFVYRAKIPGTMDPSTGTTIERGTSASVITSAGLTFEHLWKL